MPRPQKPFTTPRRGDSKTFQITITPASGLPARVCRERRRKSFQDLPDVLAHYRTPKTRPAAEAGACALIQFLKKALEEGIGQRTCSDDISVGAWIEKFTAMATSPRTGKNAAENLPYSPDTQGTYKSYYDAHIKDDPFAKLKMIEVEETDATEFISRLSLKKLKNGQPMGGSRTFAGVIIFVRMTFKEYQKIHSRWFNPFQCLDPPKVRKGKRDALSEDEILKLFGPGVLQDTMEVAVCAAMFLSGLRRSEIFALKPECLDWHTPKITVKNTWQKFNGKGRVLGPPKGKKERDAPFDPILQEAIKKLWEKNQKHKKHEFVFCFEDGTFPGPDWIRSRFSGWLKRAGIELGGRKIVPHSARHSLASLLEEKGSPSGTSKIYWGTQT